MTKTLFLEVRNLTKVFRIGGIFLGSKLTALDNINLSIGQDKTEILSLVGESGSGKTTLGRIILAIIKPTKGRVLYKSKDIFSFAKKEKTRFRKEVQPIFQNPFQSFNPLRKVDSYLRETVLNLVDVKNRSEMINLIERKLDIVGLGLNEISGKYPREFSGGQLQRVAIARALLTNPQLLVADEPVSMIDASLRMSILNILLELKQRFRMNIIYITHDLSTAYYVSDRIAVMYRGSIMEYGDIRKVLSTPMHPYTRILIQSLPLPNPRKRWKDRITLSGLQVKEFEVLGCKFSDRCPKSMDVCTREKPPEIDVNKRIVACWLYSEK